jgi:ceramide glucosyltransferase
MAVLRYEWIFARMIYSIDRTLEIVSLLGCVSSSIYYLLCLWSAGRFLRKRKAEGNRRPAQAFMPPVSILKPLKGTDPQIYESFRSHCLQEYPEYEIIFGVSDANDPAVASVEELRREFPDCAMQLVVCSEILGANVKVSNLERMAQSARYEHLIVNDSDIQVERDYLRRVIAPLTDEHVGMVTCLYRGVAAATFGSQLESLGISTDFCAGVLVAQQIEGGLRFGLGSTLAFRHADLEKICGFRSIVDFLADDYELGRRIADLGKRIVLSEVVVETHLPAYGWRGFFSHQLRWNRGVRDARLGGYIGLVTTFGLMWALANVIFARGATWSFVVLAAILLLRFVVALTVGKSVLHDRRVIARLWLLPIRDLIAVIVWIVSFAGHTVVWRGEKFELKAGRLVRIGPQAD